MTYYRKHIFSASMLLYDNAVEKSDGTHTVTTPWGTHVEIHAHVGRETKVVNTLTGKCTFVTIHP